MDSQELTLEPTLNLLQDSSPAKREAAAHALARTFKDNLRLFTLITNTLAKDKEISDRWRSFEDVADYAISPTVSSARSWMLWCWPCKRPIRACPTAIIASKPNGSG